MNEDPTSGEKSAKPDPIPAAYRQLTAVPPELRAEWKAQTEAWKANPDSVIADALDGTMEMVQYFRWMALNPPPGRQGGSISARAAREYMHVVQDLVKMVTSLQKHPVLSKATDMTPRLGPAKE